MAFKYNPHTDELDFYTDAYTKAEIGATTTGHTCGADLVGIPIVAGATNTSLHEFVNLFGSAGRATGGTVTDAGGGNVNVAAGTGFIKATDDDTAELLSFDWAESLGEEITTDTVRYVGVEYGSPPAVTVRETDNFDLDTDFALAKVVNNGGSLHILNNPWWVTDGITNIIERFQAEGHLSRDQHIGGLLIAVNGTRTLGVTAGTLWSRLNEFPISALETNTPLVASHAATFDVDNGASKGTITADSGTPYGDLSAGQKIYINGTADNDGYVKIDSIAGDNVITTTAVITGADGAEATTIISPTFELYSYTGGTWGDSNVMQYPVTHWNDLTADSGDGELTALNNNKYMNMWVYAEADDDEIAMVYGQAEYNTSSEAEAESPPTVSTHHSESGKLLGRIIIKKDTDAAVQVDTVFTTTFTASQAATHSNLAGLGEDDHTQYLKEADLTTKGDIWAASGASTPIRIGVGANDTVLTADSGETAGVKWAAGSDSGLVEATLTNKAGANTVVGYVYRLDPDNAASFDYAAEDGDYQVCVAQVADIADASTTSVVLAGVCEAYLDGVTDADISLGMKYLYFGGTSGQAKVEAFKRDGCFGEAIEDSSGAGASTCLIYPRERIGKYSLVDEPTWSKKVFLPLSIGTTGWVKGGSNPILDESDVGADSDGLSHPCVVFDGVYYWMFVASTDPDNNSYRDAIYVFRASLPEGPFSIWNNGDPILEMVAATWEAGQVCNPAVMLDYSAAGSGVDYKWKMVYFGGIRVNPYTVGGGYAYATSDPPASSGSAWTWTKHGSNPVIAPGHDMDIFFGLSLVKLGERFILTCRDITSNALEVSYSTDAVTWTHIGTLLGKGAGGTWDDAALSYVGLYFDSGILYIFYSGYSGTVYQIGMAYTSDLNLSTAATKDLTNPVVGL